jgi:glycosyltransferase involved in cell wall biosynthesis
MIVKNESNTITRLFDSVIHLIDCYCICDTGSTDDTVSIIYRYFKEKQIPGKIVYQDFVDFSHNRNYALEAALDMAEYLLLLDADMILQTFNLNWKKEELGKYDAYYLFQGNDTYFYKNIRIIRNKNIQYIGATHEYLSTPSYFSFYEVMKSQLFILDIGDAS